MVGTLSRILPILVLALAEMSIKAADKPPSFDGANVISVQTSQPAPLVPGSVMSIYGDHLGPLIDCNSSSGTNRLCDTKVLVGDIAADLLYVQERQINFRVPPGTPSNGMTDLQVIFNGQRSVPAKLPLGLEHARISVDGPLYTGMPLWLRVTFEGRFSTLRYPFDARPANFECSEVEVRRNGAPLNRIASVNAQMKGPMIHTGPICGSIAFTEESRHIGRIPVHLQYRFDQPGTYEVRYTLHEGWTKESAVRVHSAWTPISVLAPSNQQRARWLATESAHAPKDTVSLLTDFLPSILGVPDAESLRILRLYLAHPAPLVREFANYGLTYWPETK